MASRINVKSRLLALKTYIISHLKRIRRFIKYNIIRNICNVALSDNIS